MHDLNYSFKTVLFCIAFRSSCSGLKNISQWKLFHELGILSTVIFPRDILKHSSLNSGPSFAGNAGEFQTNPRNFMEHLFHHFCFPLHGSNSEWSHHIFIIRAPTPPPLLKKRFRNAIPWVLLGDENPFCYETADNVVPKQTLEQLSKQILAWNKTICETYALAYALLFFRKHFDILDYETHSRICNRIIEWKEAGALKIFVPKVCRKFFVCL